MAYQESKQNMLRAYSIAGLFTLSLRLVVGWTYTYLIMLNFSPKAAISTPGIDMSNAHVLLDNYGDRSHMAPQKDITLRPFEAIVFQLNHPVYKSFIDSLDLLE